MASRLSRISQLRQKILTWSDAYYSGKAMVSDAVFDAAMIKLRGIEVSNPKLAVENSPTKMIGTPLKLINEIKHETPMLSLDNAYSSEDILRFHQSNLSSLDKFNDSSNVLQYCCEWKFDGVAISLIYVDGVLQSCVTRGNGNVGEDVTSNFKLLVPEAKAPRVLVSEFNMGRVEVRGELYFSKTDFELLVAKRRKVDATKQNYSARNLCAGLIRSKQDVSDAVLSFSAYSLCAHDKQTPSLQTELLLKLKSLGFSTSPYLLLELNRKSDLTVINTFLHTQTLLRNNLSFETDGIVVKIDSFVDHTKLGFTARAPRGSIAYKFPADFADTILESVALQVGRTGRVTPVATFTPVYLSQAMVTQATLFSIDHVNKMKLKIGDKIRVARSGDVIPKVLEIVEPSSKLSFALDAFKIKTRTDNSFESSIVGYVATGYHCPCDFKAPLYRKIDQVDSYCIQSVCKLSKISKIAWFCSIHSIPLGEVSLEKLFGLNYLSCLEDVFILESKRSDLVKISGWGEKKCQKIFDAINHAKLNMTSTELLISFGIPNIGKETAILLLKKYRDIFSMFDAVMNREAELLELDGVGAVAVNSLSQFFNSSFETVKCLKSMGILCLNSDSTIKKTDEKYKTIDLFGGKNVLFTGSFKNSRQFWKSIIENSGGFIMSSWSKTNMLLVGAEGGLTKKQREAVERNICIVHEGDIIKQLKTL